MANEEQLKILKQGVEVWNTWRKEHPDEEIDLRGVILIRTNLSGANLRGANLSNAFLHEANLSDAHLEDAHLKMTDLAGAHLERAHLTGANLERANLERTHLERAHLGGATLITTNLRKANITGVGLYGTAHDDWIIDGIKCTYVFWDAKSYNEPVEWELEHRTPKDRDFRPGEFEELYKQLPTFDYYFKHGFTPIDAVVMDRVVQAINEKHPEFELKLSTLDSRRQPHAIFTVVHKDHVEAAQHRVTTDFEQRLAALEGKQEQMMELFARIADNPKTIELIMGDKRMIQAGQDYFEQVAGDVTTGERVSKQQEEKTWGSEPPASEGQSTL